MSSFGRYEPISPLLDFPELQVSLALDNELTARGIRMSLFDPAGLTPAERDTISSRVKQRVGGGPFMGGLVDTLMNPWVWFMMATSPAGFGALGSSSKVLFSTSRRAAHFLKEHGTILQAFKLETALQSASEGSSGAVLQALRQFMQGRKDTELELLGKPLAAALERTGLRRMDYRYIADPDQKKQAHSLGVAFEAHRRGLHHPQVEFRTVVRPKGATPPRLSGLDLPSVKKGTPGDDSVEWIRVGGLPVGAKGKKEMTVWVAKITHAPMIEGDAKGVLEKLGGKEWVDLSDRVGDHLTDLAKAVFGKEGVKELVPDEDKMFRAWRLYSNPALKGKQKGTQEGIHLIRLMMGSGLDNVHLGWMPFEDWNKLVHAVVFEPLKSGGYFPKNVYETIQNGASIQRRIDRGIVGQAVKAGGTIGRGLTSGMWHPDDLEELARLGGATPKLERMIEKARARVNRTRLPGAEPVRMLRMNPDAALVRHTQQMNSMAAMSRGLTQDNASAGPILDANARAVERGLYKELGGLAGATGKYAKSAAGEELPMGVSIRKLMGEGKTPLGGFSYADALAADASHMRNQYTLERMSDVFVPRALGMAPQVAKSALRLNFIKMKETAAGWSNSPFMRAVEKRGGFGKKLVQGLRGWAEEPIAPGEVGYATSSLTKYLYGSHLAGNMGSVLMNMMQTLGPALSVYGLKHMSEGWALAAEDMGRYVAERSRQGWKTLTEIERNDLVKRTVRLATAGPDGTDPVGVTTKVFEVLEGMYAGAGRALAQKKGPVERTIDMGLGLFQKAEWFNRLSTAYAHLSWAKQAGVLGKTSLRSPLLAQELQQAGRGLVVAEMSRAVQEFQFANDVLNVPFVFQPGQMLGNPLLRQFAAFTMRSFTIPFALSPQISGGERFFRWGGKVPLPAGVVDFGRIMGTSAVIYEMGKNLLGTDLSRYTGMAQVTDAVPFVREGRFSPEESTLPFIPPVLDIPIQGIKALGTGDTELARRTLLRMVPFGVAAERGYKYAWPGLKGLMGQMKAFPQEEELGAFGQDVGGLPAEARKIIADYRNPLPDGRVPVFKSDGTLVDYRSPTQLILQGLGFPVPDTAVPQLDRFITRNAEEMAGYRREAADRMLAGDMAGYEAVLRQWDKRFTFPGPDGVKRPLPFVLSPAQLEARAKVRTTARSERLLDRMPPEARPGYAGILAGQEPRLGLEEGGLDQGITARERRAGASRSAEQKKDEPFGGFSEYRSFRDPESKN